MRCRKRSPKRSIDCRMRGTSAISMPVPTIIFIKPKNYKIQRLQKAIASINQFAVDHARIGGKAVRFRRVRPINVHYLVAMRQQPVRNQHTVAAEVYALGTHVGGG